MIININEIKKLIEDEKITAYQVSKEVNVSQIVMLRYQKKESALENMTLNTAIELQKFINKNKGDEMRKRYAIEKNITTLTGKENDIITGFYTDERFENTYDEFEEIFDTLEETIKEFEKYESKLDVNKNNSYYTVDFTDYRIIELIYTSDDDHDYEIEETEYEKIYNLEKTERYVVENVSENKEVAFQFEEDAVDYITDEYKKLLEKDENYEVNWKEFYLKDRLFDEYLDLSFIEL